ncbi:MAG: class I SAM-dependent methyltransferase [Promethearchaeota archaeon]
MKKNKKQSNIDFRFMSFFFKIRDKFYPPVNKIRKANIKLGDIILDYGCGSGSYTIAAVEELGPNGKVFAADIHPLALEKIKKKAERMGYTNIETIQTDCATGLDNESIDKIICFDVLHDISNKFNILKEFYRVLKLNSILSFDDHHMNEDEIINLITSKGLFKLTEVIDKQYNFIKI